MQNIRKLKIVLLAVLLLCPFISGFARIHIVGSESGFEAAQLAAAAGDTIIWKPGLYYNIDLSINKSNLVVMAEIPGKTVFSGASKAYISGNNLTFSGFQYLNGNIGTDHVLVVSGSHNHLTQLNIKNYYCSKYVIIQENCEYNVLSYCNLEQRAFIGNQNILSILVSENKPGYHTIRYCSFKNFEGTGGDMGTEAIRIGLSTMGEFISRSVVEYCYFTQCNGDSEIISHKSRQNVYRYNTFEDNPLGELVLRHGDEGVVYGNFFLNGMGGVRIKEGQDHVVFNNYFSGITSRAINLQNYDVDPLSDITIAYNTIVACAPSRLGSSGNYPPTNITFANNIFTDPLANHFSQSTGQEIWIGNISSGSLGIDRPEGIRDADPGLEMNSEGFFGLSTESTAIDSAQSGYPGLPNYPGMGIDYEVLLDLMQQLRPEEISMKDIGCSEYPQEVDIKPHVTEENTGPSYIHNENFYILDIDRQGQGSVLLDPPSGVYDSGEVVTLTAIPGTYRFFDAWSGDLEGNSNPDTLVMDGNKAVTAHFETLPLYNISIFIEGSGHVEVDPPGWSYPDSTRVTLTAFPDSGYVFSQWTGNLTGTENPLSLIVTGDIISFANFKPFTVGISSDPVPGAVLDPSSFQVFPNPVSQVIRASFVLGAGSSIQLSLYDLQGAELRKVQPGWMEPGQHLVETDISDLPVGVYMLELSIVSGSTGETSTHSLVKKLIKLSTI